MKRILLSLLFLLGIQHCVQISADSWVEKFLNPKTIAIGLGTLLVGTNFAWYIGYKMEAKENRQNKKLLSTFGDIDTLKKTNEFLKISPHLPERLQRKPREILYECYKVLLYEDAIQKAGYYPFIQWGEKWDSCTCKLMPLKPQFEDSLLPPSVDHNNSKQTNLAHNVKQKNPKYDKVIAQMQRENQQKLKKK